MGLHHNRGYYAVILLAALLVYWPLTFNVFTLKNDALSYFLPWRYHISQSVQHGAFPFWSPYLYTGLPLHADIQSGVWNPIVLVFSLFTTYNMSVLQWETLLYIIFAGIGFFKLCRFFALHPAACLMMAIAYQCSGFMPDSGSFIPWIASAAWMPFVFYYFLQVITTPRRASAVKLGLSLFLLFSAGYPSFFIYTAYILLVISIIHIIGLWIKREWKRSFSKIAFLAGALLLFGVLAAPAILSYYNFFPYYRRGSGASLDEAQFNPMRWKDTISFMFPQASYKIEDGNDISTRNAYFGLFPLIFLLLSFSARWNRYQKIILVLTLISFLVSLGSATPVREWLYHALPFMDSFRHPGTMRIFAVGGLLLLAAFGLNGYLHQPNDRQLKLWSALLLIPVSAAIVMGCVHGGYRVPEFSMNTIKQFLDASTPWTWMLIGGIIQLLFILPILFQSSITRKELLTGSVLNVAIFTALSMPFTMVSQYRVKEVNAFVRSFPEGFPADLAALPVLNRQEDSSVISVFGYSQFYNKRISIQDHVITPTLTRRYADFLGDAALRTAIATGPFARLDLPEGKGTVKLEKFVPDSVRFTVQNSEPTTFILVQQYHPSWKAFVDGRWTRIKPGLTAFMTIPLAPGNHVVSFRYEPTLIMVLAAIAVLVLLASGAYLIYSRFVAHEQTP
jgi:hypothetical protein